MSGRSGFIKMTTICLVKSDLSSNLKNKVLDQMDFDLVLVYDNVLQILLNYIFLFIYINI